MSQVWYSADSVYKRVTVYQSDDLHLRVVNSRPFYQAPWDLIFCIFFHPV